MSRQVLVVEDDAGLREALVDTLSLAGYDCVESNAVLAFNPLAKGIDAGAAVGIACAITCAI